MRVLRPAGVFTLVILALIGFAENRTRIGGWLDGLSHKAGEGRLIGRNQAVVQGVRLSLNTLEGGEITALGVNGHPDVRSHGYGIQMTTGAASDALFVNYGLQQPVTTAAGIEYEVHLSGEVGRGAPQLLLTCGASKGASDRGPKLPDISAIDAKRGWSVTGTFEPVASDIGPATRISGEKGQFLGYASLGPILKDHKITAGFWARATAGKPHVTALLARGGGYDGATLVFKPGANWNFYVLAHPGQWTGDSPMHFGFTQSGGRSRRECLGTQNA